MMLPVCAECKFFWIHSLFCAVPGKIRVTRQDCAARTGCFYPGEKFIKTRSAVRANTFWDRDDAFASSGKQR